MSEFAFLFAKTGICYSLVRCSRWNDIDRGDTKNSEKILPQCHFVHYNSHMDWTGREPGRLRIAVVYARI
jgi:hypothetical protein